MKAAVIVYPGSNCDNDAVHALRMSTNFLVETHWHEEPVDDEYDFVILPGGFSFGDHLRTGAVAARSVATRSLSTFSGFVLGICNGFQILLEAGLLPGAMRMNEGTRFICRDIHLRTERSDTAFTNLLPEVIRLPIAHMQGNYFVENHEILSDITVFRYCDQDGQITAESNPNGSIDNVAGIMSHNGRVLGMMPHPERNAEEVLGTGVGNLVFKSVEAWLTSKEPV